MADYDFDRISRAWQVSQDQLVPLSVAAAMTFYQSQDARASARPAGDVGDALNLAASALSRLVSVYNVQEDGARVCVQIDLTSGSFAQGATEFRRRDGTVLASMMVRRGDAVSAMSLIRRSGIAFVFG